MRERNWLRDLTKPEIIHMVVDANCLTIETFKKTRESQGAANIKCLECEIIARKLKLPALNWESKSLAKEGG